MLWKLAYFLTCIVHNCIEHNSLFLVLNKMLTCWISYVLTDKSTLRKVLFNSL
jgi:hypothetical protein